MNAETDKKIDAVLEEAKDAYGCDASERRLLALLITEVRELKEALRPAAPVGGAFTWPATAQADAMAGRLRVEYPHFKKIAVIKALREVLNLPLKDAKDLSEGTVSRVVSDDELQRLQRMFARDSAFEGCHARVE